MVPALVLLPGLLALVSPPSPAEQRYEGIAYPLGGGAPVYRETHWLYREAGVPARLVLYRCPGGAPFARKRVRETPSAIAPGFDFEDARDGFREGVRERGRGREVYVQAREGAPVEVRAFDAPPGTVVDAGFDAWIRQHWSTLEAGPGLRVPFLIPARFRAYDFRIDAAGEAREQGRAVRRLRMRLDSWLGFALPELRLTYDVAGRRLLRFEGPGTIRDERGRPQAVRIEFPQPPVLAGASSADIAAALRQPLVARCDA